MAKMAGTEFVSTALVKEAEAAAGENEWACLSGSFGKKRLREVS